MLLGVLQLLLPLLLHWQAAHHPRCCRRESAAPCHHQSPAVQPHIDMPQLVFLLSAARLVSLQIQGYLPGLSWLSWLSEIHCCCLEPSCLLSKAWAFRAAAAASSASAVGGFGRPSPEAPGQQWQQQRQKSSSHRHGGGRRGQASPKSLWLPCVCNHCMLNGEPHLALTPC